MSASLPLYPTPISQLQHFSTPRLTQALYSLGLQPNSDMKNSLLQLLLVLLVLCIAFGWYVDRTQLAEQIETTSEQHLFTGQMQTRLGNVERKLTNRAFDDESRVLSLMLQLSKYRLAFDTCNAGWSADVHFARLLFLQSLTTEREVFDWVEKVSRDSEMGLLDFRASQIMTIGSREQIEFSQLISDAFDEMTDDKFLRWQSDPNSIAHDKLDFVGPTDRIKT